MQKISIIIPIFNGEECLEECLESVINQTYKNIEIILINDGSKDNSINILNKYKKKDKRIVIIDDKNEGVSSARNKGIEASTSNWVIFVDCDDIMEKDAVEKFASLIEKNVDLVISKLSILKNGKKEVVSCKIKDKKYMNKQEKNELIQSVFYDNYMEKMAYISCVFAKMYNKEFLTKNKILFNTNLKYGEDCLFNLEVFNKCKKIAFINEPTYTYRVKADWIFTPLTIELHTKMLTEFKTYLKNNKMHKKYENEYNYFVLRQINKYLKFYFFKKGNIKSKDDLKDEFFKLIKSEPYNLAINKKSIDNLHLKRKIMKYLLKHNQFAILKKIYEIGAKK